MFYFCSLVVGKSFLAGLGPKQKGVPTECVTISSSPGKLGKDSATKKADIGMQACIGREYHQKGCRMTKDDLGKLMAAAVMAEGHRSVMPTSHKKLLKSREGEYLSTNPTLSHKLDPARHTKYER